MTSQEVKSSLDAQQQIEEFERRCKLYAEEWLECLRKAKRCVWCACDDALNRRHLCVPCEKRKEEA